MTPHPAAALMSSCSVSTRARALALRTACARTMQDVIKMTFTALHDVIKAQGSAIKSLEREVKTKVSAADMEGALMHKANIVDVNSSLQDVSTGFTHVCQIGGVLVQLPRDQ